MGTESEPSTQKLGSLISQTTQEGRGTWPHHDQLGFANEENLRQIWTRSGTERAELQVA